MCGEQKSTSEAASQELSRWLFERESLTSLKLAGEARPLASKLGGSADLCVSSVGITSSRPDTGGFFLFHLDAGDTNSSAYVEGKSSPAEPSPNLGTVDL